MDSQTAVWDFQHSQEMPPAKKQRRGSSSRPPRRNAKMSIPLSIRTRGTPNGYYEIPTRNLLRLYCNTSTGFFNTSQTTGAPSGATGYRGLGIATFLDQIEVRLGEGSSSVTINDNVPGFSGLQGVFDQCKISSMKLKYWWSNQTSEASSTAGVYGAPDLYVVEDPNNIDPPSNVGAILQYGKVIRVPGDSNQGQKTQYINTPHIRVDAGASVQDTGTTTSLALTQHSTYVSTLKPDVAHFGVRGWVEIPTGASNSRTMVLNILIEQVRRYKTSV